MSIKKAVLLGVLCLLPSCARPYSPALLPPSLCTEVRRAQPLPDEAAIVQPATQEEREGLRTFLTWFAETISLGEENADRAEEARSIACRKPD